MKRKHLIGGLILSTFMSLGAVVAFNSAKSESKPVEAATTYWNAGDIIYVRLYNGFFDASATAYANYPDGNGNWHSEKITTSITTKGDETLYKYTFSYAAQSFQILRKNSTGSDQWGYTDSHTSHSTNLFEVTGYGGGQYLNSNFASASVVNITLTQPASGGSIAVKDKNSDASGAGYYYSDWTVQFTATPSAGYFFKNWTDGSGTDWQGADSYNNPAELTNLSGNFGVSCKFTSYASQTWKVLGDQSGTWDAQHQDINVALGFKTGSDTEDDGPQYYTTSLTLSAGAVFKVVDMNVQPNAYYGFDCLETGEGSARDAGYVEAASGDSDPNIRVVTAGTYEIYMKTNSHKIWLQISSRSEAIAYGTVFLATIKCTGSATNFSLNDWNIVDTETTSMEYKYNHLTSGARSYLSELIANESGNDAEKAVARYDYILGKYGYGTQSGKYHDFMNRTPAPHSSGAQILVIGDSGSSVFLGISVVAVASIASIGGYLFLRKKKEN